MPALSAEALRTPIFNIDDAYQGILAKRIGVEPSNNRGFQNWGGRLDTCSLRKAGLMTVHIGRQMSPQKIRDIWTNFNDASIKC